MEYPPKNWPELADWLDGLNMALFDWPAFWRLLDSWKASRDHAALEEVMRQIEQADRTFSEETTRCAQELAATGTADWSHYSPGSISLMRMRAEILGIFVMTCYVGPEDAQETPITFPPNPPEFVRWLLIDWWAQHGAEEAATAYFSK